MIGKMDNPFDREQYSTSTPDSITIGQFVGWKSNDDYNDTDYTLRYVFTSVNCKGKNLEITGSLETLDAGECWVFEIPTAMSKDWSLSNDDDYRWDLMLTEVSSSNETPIRSGFTRIFLSNSDRRTHAEIMLSQINALLEGRAKNDVSSYSIKSRSITKMTVEELLMWRGYYVNEIKQTGGSVSTGKKRAKRNTVQVRFE